MKVALVCDWLTNVGGAEKVLLELHRLYPDAPIYTSKYDPKGIDWFKDADVRTGWLQKFPSKMRRFLGPFRQRYFSHLKLEGYDLVISVTGAEAKSVRVPDGVHICYCHVPTQYYWQMYNAYLKNPGFGLLNPLVRICFKLLVGPLRRADFKAAQRPDYYVTISEYAKQQIKWAYGKDATIIHPPVEIDNFKNSETSKAQGDSQYIITSRQVNWKRVDLAVRACMMTQRKLTVIGEGPEHKKLVKIAEGAGNIKFLPLMKKEKLAEKLAEAKGYLFPSLEPFGIAPVEALAAGCPVIALGEGGALDYVEDGKNGVLFEEQTAKSLAEAILRFEKMKFNRTRVSKTADKFSVVRFDEEIKCFVKINGTKGKNEKDRQKVK